jgi:rod shape-determining protein MreD
MRAAYEPSSPWWAVAGLVLSLVAALFVQGAAARLFGGSGLFPNLVLIVLFVWSVRRPYFIAPPVLLAVGLIQDLFTGAPFGIWALAYLVGFTAARDREADGAGGEAGPLVVRFAALAAITQFTAWAAGSAVIAAPAPVGGLIGEAILTIVLCPLFVWAFARRRERSSFG